MKPPNEELDQMLRDVIRVRVLKKKRVKSYCEANGCVYPDQCKFENSCQHPNLIEGDELERDRTNEDQEIDRLACQH